MDGSTSTSATTLDRPPTTPTTAWLSVIDACNNRCAWCYEQENGYRLPVIGRGGTGRSKSRMSASDAARALRTLTALGLRRCIVLGGEPTLHPQLPEIMEESAFLGLETTLVTNGRRCADPRYARRLARTGATSVTVSMHGWSEATYEGTGRSPAGFHESVRGYETLRAAGMHTGITIVLGAHTLGAEAPLLDFVQALGARQFGLNVGAPAVSQSGVSARHTLPPAAYARHVMELFREARARELWPSFQLGLPLCLFSDDELAQLLAADAIRQGCHVMHGTGIVIRPDLQPAICTHLLDFPLAGDDVLSDEDAFLSFWNQPSLAATRARASVHRSSKCAECSLWGRCGGGCMIHWTHHDPIATITAPRARPM